MNKRTIFGILIAVILLSLGISLGLAQEVQPESADNSGPILTANSPWFTSWVDNITSANVGSHSSIAYSPIDGMPYISYYDATNGNLMLASPVPNGGSNCGVGGNWWCRVVDGDGVGDHSNADVGKYSSIAFWEDTGGFISWKLGITYYDVTNNALKYAVYHKFGLNPASWDLVTIASSEGLFGSGDGTFTSLKYSSSGTPNIAYYAWRFSLSGTIGYLKHAYSVTSGGNCGVDADAGKWQCDSVDHGIGGGGVGQYASLDVDYDDQVYIAYYDGGNGDLKYAYFGGIGTCDSGWICSTIDQTGDVGQFASLKAKQSASDTIHIAYYDKTNGNLKYATSGWSGGSGNCGSGNSWQCLMVDTIGSGPGMTQVGISLAMDAAGDPIIAYQNASEDLAPAMLNIARPAAAYNNVIAIGNCGDVPPGYLFMVWQCNTIDNAAYGYGNVNLADYASVAVGPDGLATIAYYEIDDYNVRNSLKVAYQLFFQTFLPIVSR